MKDDNDLLLEAYREIVLQENLVDIFRNAAMPILQYFRCLKGVATSKCPSADQVVQHIKQWLQDNPNVPFAQVVNKMINSDANPVKALANLKYQLDYTLRDPSSIMIRR